jgi:hypothetical protein
VVKQQRQRWRREATTGESFPRFPESIPFSPRSARRIF